MARLRWLRTGAGEFRWTGRLGYLRTASGAERCVHLRVMPAGRGGGSLTALLVSAGPLGPWGVCTDTSYPTPREVRAILDHALAQGWDPAAQGADFAVTAELDGWEVHSPSHAPGRVRHHLRMLSAATPADEPALLERASADRDPQVAEAVAAEHLDRRAAELLTGPGFPAWLAALPPLGAPHAERLRAWSLLRAAETGAPWTPAEVLALADRHQRTLAERATDPALLALLATAAGTPPARAAATTRLSLLHPQGHPAARCQNPLADPPGGR
ncbi:hypothetical protein [Kitasatospora camelliae]|uniref:PE-PGRS family protein n=1 Tax=Kitasatospora camelliae TaxID=3156397 RepID=A0AAU8JUH4_9ACTN